MRKSLLYWSLSLLFCFTGCSGSGGEDPVSEETPVSTPPISDESSNPAVPVFKILIASGDTNHRGITSYALDGSGSENILDLRSFGATPNGLAIGFEGSFLTSVDGADSILSVPYSEDHSFFYGSGLLSGNIYDIEYGPVMNYYYVVESNRIEVFNSSGSRQASALIPAILGACSLTAPRNMHATDDGLLYVADYSGNRILKYDISNHEAVCLESYSVPGLQPYAVIKHSNGLLYFSSYAQDAIFTLNEGDASTVNIYDPGLTILRDPRGLAELPNGDVIVSSSVMDTIEKIDESGARQGFAPFISDIFSLNITDIEILEAP